MTKIHHQGPQDTPTDFFQSYEWRSVRQIVLIRDGKVCRYCGDPGFRAGFVRPYGKGGLAVPENLVCSCERCSRLVGGLAFPDFEAKKARCLSLIANERSKKTGKVIICEGELPDVVGWVNYIARKQRWGKKRKYSRAKPIY